MTLLNQFSKETELFNPLDQAICTFDLLNPTKISGRKIPFEFNSTTVGHTLLQYF